jgi:hypothetical protein
MRFFCYTMGDESAPMTPPTPEMMAEMGQWVDEAMKAGWLIETGGFAPTTQAVKVRLENGKFTTTDGPFAEAKELIGGWALVEFPSRDEAIEMMKKFLTITGDGESVVRQVLGPEDDFDQA